MPNLQQSNLASNQPPSLRNEDAMFGQWYDELIQLFAEDRSHTKADLYIKMAGTRSLYNIGYSPAGAFRAICEAETIPSKA